MMDTNEQKDADRQFRRQLYEEACSRGVDDPVREADRAWTFITTGKVKRQVTGRADDDAPAVGDGDDEPAGAPPPLREASLPPVPPVGRHGETAGVA